MDTAGIEDGLISEAGLTRLQARVYLMITTGGKKTAVQIASKAGISESEALSTARSLVDAGSFIELHEAEFEAMHPRFAAVNMYRRACERNGTAFVRNNTVDNIGAALEDAYDDARTK